MDGIIVRNGACEEYDLLHKAYGHQMLVVWDRRRPRTPPTTSSETGSSASVQNRRQKLPLSWTALGFVFVDRLAE